MHEVEHPATAGPGSAHAGGSREPARWGLRLLLSTLHVPWTASSFRRSW